MFLKFKDVQQQQQLPNISRIRGVWGDPDVHDLTPTRTSHVKRVQGCNDVILCLSYADGYILEKLKEKTLFTSDK